MLKDDSRERLVSVHRILNERTLVIVTALLPFASASSRDVVDRPHCASLCRAYPQAKASLATAALVAIDQTDVEFGVQVGLTQLGLNFTAAADG